MCIPLESLQQVVKLACIMLRTPHSIITTYVATVSYKLNSEESNLRPLDYDTALNLHLFFFSFIHKLNLNICCEMYMHF